jgi:hypothetical protein
MGTPAAFRQIKKVRTKIHREHGEAGRLSLMMTKKRSRNGNISMPIQRRMGPFLSSSCAIGSTQALHFHCKCGTGPSQRLRNQFDPELTAQNRTIPPDQNASIPDRKQLPSEIQHPKARLLEEPKNIVNHALSCMIVCDSSENQSHVSRCPFPGAIDHRDPVSSGVSELPTAPYLAN